MTRRWLPQWVSEYRDRHGKPRYRFRRKGFAQYLFKHAPGTEGFRQEYEACKAGHAAAPIEPGGGRGGFRKYVYFLCKTSDSNEKRDPELRTCL